jgi:hypothetical protein
VPTHGEEVEAIEEIVLCGPRDEDSEPNEPAQKEVAVVEKGLSSGWYDETMSNDEPTFGNAVDAEQTISSGSFVKDTTNEEEHQADGPMQVDNAPEPLNENTTNKEDHSTNELRQVDVVKQDNTEEDVIIMEPSPVIDTIVELKQTMAKVARMTKSAPQWINTSQDVDGIEPSAEDGPAVEQTHHMADADGMAQDARWWTQVEPDWKRRKRKDGSPFGGGGVTGRYPKFSNFSHHVSCVALYI